jgi:hypothetical protein
MTTVVDRRTSDRRTSARGRPPPGARGSITAETAVAFPALVLILAISLWGVSAAAAQVACVDAARAGARAAARGEPESQVRAAVLRAAPPRARVFLSRDPVTTRVVVEAQVRPPVKGLFPPLELQAQALTATEPQGRDGNSPATEPNADNAHGSTPGNVETGDEKRARGG